MIKKVLTLAVVCYLNLKIWLHTRNNNKAEMAESKMIVQQSPTIVQNTFHRHPTHKSYLL